MVVDDHVTANLGKVQVIIPYLDEADNLIADDMEDEDG